MTSTLTESDKLVIATLLSTAMTALQPISERLTAVSERLNAVSGDVAAVSERLNSLHNNFCVVATKAHNAACSKDDTLEKVPLCNGAFPVSDYPQSLPNGQVNNWNA